MSSSSSNKSDARRRTDQDHETDQITYGHFNPGVGHDIPGAGGRRRTENVPPGLQATLETSREEYQQFVERETSRDPAPLSTTPRFPESTAAVAAAARTNFTATFTVYSLTMKHHHHHHSLDVFHLQKI